MYNEKLEFRRVGVIFGYNMLRSRINFHTVEYSSLCIFVQRTPSNKITHRVRGSSIPDE